MGSLLVDILHKWNYKQAITNDRAFFKTKEWEFTLIAILVDDLVSVLSSPHLLADFKNKLQKTNDKKFFGKLKTSIGWELQQTDDRIGNLEQRYTKKLLKKHNLTDCSFTQTLMSTNANFSLWMKDKNPLSHAEYCQYRIEVEKLLYLAVCTRSDVIFTTCVPARCLHAPSAIHLTMIRRVMSYLSETKHFGLLYKSEEQFDIKTYSNSGWAGCFMKRNSTTIFIITINNALVSWVGLYPSLVILAFA